jgi:broad specificity phosphatase PhoE
MKNLFFIRHAESQANVQNILASQIDFPLSKKGRQDAARIAEAFSQKQRIERIISSPLTRAVQTAEAFARLNNTAIERNDLLMEQHLGRYSGLTYDEVQNEAEYVHDREKRWQWVPEGGGESYEMIAKRLTTFFLEFTAQQNHYDTLIVTHAVTLRMVRALLENTIPEYPLEIAKNGEIWQTEFQTLGQYHPIKSIFLGNSEEMNHRA